MFVSNRNVGAIIGIVALLDVNPPLSYLFIRLVLLFGQSDIWLRIPFEFLGALSCGLAFLLFRRAGMKLAWLAGALLAILPMHVYLSQEIRYHALSFVLSTLWMFTLLEYEQDPTKIRVGFVLVRILGMLNHYYFFLLFLVDWAYLAWRHRRDVLKYLLRDHLRCGLYYLPWLFALANQALKHTSIHMFFRPTVAPLLMLKNLFSHIFFYAADAPAPSSILLFKQNQTLSLAILSMPIMFVMISGALASKQYERAKKLALSWLIVPIAVVLLITWKMPLYSPRYFVIVLGAFCGLLALGIENLFMLSRVIGTVFSVFIITIWSLVLYEYHTNKLYQRENWRGLAQYLESQQTLRHAGIVVLTEGACGGLKYYYNGELIAFSIIPSKGSPFGKYDMEIINNRFRALENLQEIYFIEYNPRLFDPEGVVKNWLEQRYLKVEDFWSQYKIPGGKYVRKQN